MLHNEPNFFVGAPCVRVQLPHPVHARLLVCFAVVFFRRRSIVIVWHVGSGDNKMFVRPSEAVCAHVVLILLEHDGSARDEEALIVRMDSSAVAAASPFLRTLPQAHITDLKLCLHVPAQEVVDARAQDAWPACEQGVNSVGHREDGVRAKHVVVVYGREAIPDIVHYNLNGTGKKRMGGGGGDETIPEAAPVPHVNTGLKMKELKKIKVGFVKKHTKELYSDHPYRISHIINGSHETNVVRDGIVQVSLEEHIHIRVNAATNQ